MNAHTKETQSAMTPETSLQALKEGLSSAQVSGDRSSKCAEELWKHGGNTSERGGGWDPIFAGLVSTSQPMWPQSGLEVVFSCYAVSGHHRVLASVCMNVYEISLFESLFLL